MYSIHGFVVLIKGADVRNVKREDAGRVLSDQLRVIMQEMKVVNGLKAVGYDTEHIPQLVKGTLPQVQHTFDKQVINEYINQHPVGILLLVMSFSGDKAGIMTTLPRQQRPSDQRRLDIDTVACDR